MMASHKNMTNGDYVYIAVHPFATSETFLRNTHSLHNYVWILPWMGYHGKGEGKNAFFFGSKEEMVKAYQGLFVLMPQVMIFKLKFLICIRIYWYFVHIELFQQRTPPVEDLGNPGESGPKISKGGLDKSIRTQFACDTTVSLPTYYLLLESQNL